MTVSLDMSQTAVKKMIAEARERGYITYEQFNQVLPPDQVSSEQIEDVMSMLSEMGINIIEDEDAEEDDQKGSTAVVQTSSAREVTPYRPPRPKSWTARTTRCACICAKWARSNCCRVKAKSRSRNGSRPVATR